MSWRLIQALVFLVSCLLPTAVVKGDYVMGPPEVNESLKNMTNLKTRATQAASKREKAEALFSLAMEAEELSSLMNEEIMAHGFDQRALIDLAVRRCAALEITIFYDDGKRAYLYDRAAFGQYLELQPKGAHADEARFLVLEKTFYTQKETDETGLRKFVQEAARFKKTYPRYERKSELDLFLAISYLNLSRLEDKKQSPGGAALKGKAVALFNEIVQKYPNTPEASTAQRVLTRLNTPP
ncbi:MAG: hypothetical protein HY315_06410 [Acidobacteria bacterium]|nr:hypothetical protein [Acidobacteriota bacterium]